MPRKYDQRKRAEQQEETRQRITRAAMELHELEGPARTTMSAVAERAGVQRNTLYRHFPDEQALTFACSGMFMDENPIPDPAAWREMSDPLERVRHGLGETYAYWESTEAMTANVLRDAEHHEPTRVALETRSAHGTAELRDALAAGWKRGRPSRRLLATIELAIAFRTWQSLVRQSGLTSPEAADLMADLVAAAAGRGVQR
jgi:AcrR family transcriptional regulator